MQVRAIYNKAPQIKGQSSMVEVIMRINVETKVSYVPNWKVYEFEG